MSNELRSWLRTTVPAAWSALVTYLATLGTPTWILDALGDIEVALVPLVLAAVYAALRAAEPHMPPWLTRLALGSDTPPNYTPPTTFSGS